MKKIQMENILRSKGYVSIETLIVAGLIIASGSFMVSKLAWKGKDISVKSNNSLTNSKKILDNDNFSNVNIDNKTQDSVKKDVVNIKPKTSIKSYDEIIRTPGSKYILYRDILCRISPPGVPNYCRYEVLGKDIPKTIDIYASKEKPIYTYSGERNSFNPDVSKMKLHEKPMHCTIGQTDEDKQYNDSYSVFDEDNDIVAEIYLDKKTKLYTMYLKETPYDGRYNRLNLMDDNMPIYAMNALHNKQYEYVGTAGELKNKYNEVTSKPNAIWLYDTSNMLGTKNRMKLHFGVKPDSDGNITINATEEKPIIINDKTYTKTIKAHINKDDNNVYFDNKEENGGEKIGRVTNDGCAKIYISEYSYSVLEYFRTLDYDIFNEGTHENRLNVKYHC